MLQCSPEWFQARLGKVTASRMADVMAKSLKGKRDDGTSEAISRRNYRRELALERFTNTSQDSGYVSWAMQEGIRKEDGARDAYAFAKGVDVEEIGFVVHPEIKDAGASPDGLVGKDGLVEIKCPEANVMFEMLTKTALDSKYIYQAQWQLACCPERQWVDVVFYREGCPLEIVTLVRDSQHIDKLEAAVKKFLLEVASDLRMLQERQKWR